MKTTLIILLSLLTTMTFAQDQLTLSEFEQFCDDAGLIFEMPEGYKIVEVKENRDLAYSFAILNEAGTMEIRYSIWPLQEAIEKYKESLEDENVTMIHPNKIYSGIIQANVLNMTGGQMADIGPFPTDAVQREFNADAGGSSFFEFNCGFGKGYTFGQFIYLHKDDVADVIVTFMSNDKTTHGDLMFAGFHSLKFKEKD